MYAYSEKYLEDAMNNLGEAMEYASLRLGLSLDFFMKLFIATNIAEQFGHGVPKFVCGLSGTELALYVCEEASYPVEYKEAVCDYSYPAQYWCGWIMAWFQWKYDLRFSDIHACVSMQEIEDMYTVLHEAPEEKFADIMLSRMAEKRNISHLQEYRKRLGYTQKELAEHTGVNLRTLQQYESGAKNIRRAAGEHLVKLARVLCCEEEDLL